MWIVILHFTHKVLTIPHLRTLSSHPQPFFSCASSFLPHPFSQATLTVFFRYSMSVPLRCSRLATLSASRRLSLRADSISSRRETWQQMAEGLKQAVQTLNPDPPKVRL